MKSMGVGRQGAGAPRRLIKSWCPFDKGHRRQRSSSLKAGRIRREDICDFTFRDLRGSAKPCSHIHNVRRWTMRNVILAAVTLALVGVTAPSNAQQATTKEQLAGSWKVLSLKATTGSNVVQP